MRVCRSPSSLLLIGIRVLVFRIWVAHEHVEGTVLKLHVNVRASMCHVLDHVSHVVPENTTAHRLGHDYT
jgi:hypothetical protein